MKDAQGFDSKKNGVLKKTQYIHVRAYGDINANVWIDPNDRSKGKKDIIISDSVLPAGGATICYLPSNNSSATIRDATIGVSVCVNWENYSKEIGRGRALGAAMRSSNSYDLMTFDELVEVGMAEIREIINKTLEFKENYFDNWYKDELQGIEAFRNMGESLEINKREKVKV